MVKATLRSAVLLGLLVWSVPGFAEVQNVKVGGEITARAFHRNNLDVNDEKNNTNPGGSSTLAGLDADNFLMSTTALNVSADLTENVSAKVRLTNERDWDSTAGGGTTDFDLSQAYVTFKELFYSPLTLRVGMQPIVWGRGFILGSNLLPSVNGTGDDRNSSISSNEFTDFTAFDAIRASLDLSSVAGLGMPLNIDYVYIKSDENTVGSTDDVNIQGINFGTRLDAAHSELEMYLLNKSDHSTGTTAAGGTASNDNAGSTFTWGVRGSAKPVDGSNLYGELAYQFGTTTTDPAGVRLAGERQQAWALDLGGDYTFSGVATKPKLGAEWRFYSGTKTPQSFTGPAGGGGSLPVQQAAGGWSPVAPGYFTTALREFQTQSTVAGFYPVDQKFVTTAQTNQNELALYGSLAPIEDLTVAPRLSFFFLDEGMLPIANSKRKSYVGAEWDTMVTYNYTDDVQFGLLYALFAPGNVFRTPNDATAQELVTSVSVRF